MNVRKIKKPATHEGWLAVRKMGITGTDLAGIAGVSRFSSPMSIYLDKMGLTPPKEANEAMEIGSFMEDPIAKLWTMRHPSFKIQRVNAILQHPKHDWMLGNIDRLITFPGEGILEVKNVGAYSGASWGDEDEEEVPPEYYLQLMWYLTVCGVKEGRFAALVGGNKLISRTIEFDKQFSEQLIEMAHHFWQNHVLGETPPAIDGGDTTTDLINNMFRNPEPVLIHLPHAEEWAHKKIEAEKRLKLVEKEVEEAKNNIKYHMGDDADEAICGRYHSTWKTVEVNRFDSKALQQDHPDLYKAYLKTSTQRRFTIKQRRIE